MKKVLLIFAIGCFLSSCTATYYQVYRVETELEKKKDAIVYSDEYCDVIYNLWDENGNLSFVFMNRSDKDIVLDLSRSFFIKNGIAFDYYEDKSYTEGYSKNYSSTVGVLDSYTKQVTKSGYTHTPYLWTPTMIGVSRGKTMGTTQGKNVSYNSSVTTHSVKTITVPAQSSKVVTGFIISNYIYKDKEDKDFNRPKNISREINYSKEISPLLFRNRIYYSIDGRGYYIDNEFWVSCVKNMSEKKFKKTIIHKDSEEEIIIIDHSAAMFYNSYSVEL